MQSLAKVPRDLPSTEAESHSQKETAPDKRELPRRASKGDSLSRKRGTGTALQSTGHIPLVALARIWQSWLCIHLGMNYHDVFVD